MLELFIPEKSLQEKYFRSYVLIIIFLLKQVGNYMALHDTEEEKLRKELIKAQELIQHLKKRETLLRNQFAFFIKYDQQIVNSPEIPTL